MTDRQDYIIRQLLFWGNLAALLVGWGTVSYWAGYGLFFLLTRGF